jgi:SAM-dependent methyltransferase
VNQVGYDLVKRPGHSLVDYYEGFGRESRQNRLFYNIAAGTFQHPYWTNVDYATEHYRSAQRNPFINYNLMELGPLPIASNSAEIVYSSHTVEHVSDEAVLNMFREAHRILKPGGGIRVTTNDPSPEFRAYQRKDRCYWYWIDWYSRPGTWETLYTVPLSQASIQQLFLHHYASQLCQIDVDQSASKKYSDSEIDEVFSQGPLEDALTFFTNQCRYNPEHPGNHISWWTGDKLISFLRKAGFTDCYRSGFGQSAFPPLRDTRFFDMTHPRISVYVEATK